MPLDQWWFWMLLIPLGGICLAAISTVGDAMAKIARAKRGGGGKEMAQIHQEIKAIKMQLADDQKTQKVLEFQKQLSIAEIENIEEKTLPEGIAVFLFTDIEGFTNLLDTQGDQRAFELLQQHNDICRKSVQSHDGIELKQLGDGFMFCFSSAKKAVMCAAEIQQKLKELSQQTHTPVRVRMGIHAGEPIQNERDFIGQTVSLTERIMGQADGGQIFVSEVVKNIVGMMDGFQFADQGARRLQGFSEAQKLYEFQRIEAISSPLDSEVEQQLQEMEHKLEGKNKT